jgi:hypothetical protein
MIKIDAFNTFLARLNKREKLILYCAAAAISLTLLDRLVIVPVTAKLQSLSNEIDDKQTAIKRSLRILSQKDRIMAEATKYNSYLDGLKSEDEQMTSILREIEALGNKSTVYLIDLKPAGVKDMGSYKKYFVTLSCEAQVEQLVNFFYGIENSDKLLSIDKYQLMPKSTESSIAKCTMTISKMALP